MTDKIAALFGKSPAQDTIEAIEEMRGALLLRNLELQTRKNERIVRWLLEQWVSELEPCLVMRRGQIEGLAWAGTRLGGHSGVVAPQPD